MAQELDYRAWKFLSVFTNTQAAHLIYGFNVIDPHLGSRGLLAPIRQRIIEDHARAVESLLQKFRSSDGKTVPIDPANMQLEVGCLPSEWVIEILETPIEDYGWFRHKCEFQITCEQEFRRQVLAKWLQENNLQSAYDFVTGEATGSRPTEPLTNAGVISADRKAEVIAIYTTLSGYERGEFLNALIPEFENQTKIAKVLGLVPQTVSKHILAWKNRPEQTHKNNLFGSRPSCK